MPLFCKMLDIVRLENRISFSFPITLYSSFKRCNINLKNRETMRKKILFASLFLVTIATVTFYSHSRKNDLSNLMLENIEALASGESGSMTYCFGSGSVDCPVTHVKVEIVRYGS